MMHRTKDGREIPISELETDHLENIVKRIEELARKGIVVRYGGGSCAEDFYYDEETLTGPEALRELKYHEYNQELEKRSKAEINTPKA